MGFSSWVDEDRGHLIGADVNLQGVDGRTAAMRTPYDDQFDCLYRLLQVDGFYPNPNLQTVRGITIATRALLRNSPGCLNVLRNVPEVDWYLEPIDGWSALSL